MSKKRFILISLFVLLSTNLWAKDPIAWSLNQNFPNPITINTGSYSVQYTFKNQLPFTLVHPINITKTISSSEFTFTDLCSGKKLAPNETCTVDVLLTPTSPGLKTVSLTIECYDKNQVKLPALTTTAIPPPPVYTVGGQTQGLISGTLVLQNNGGDNISLTSNGPFTFPTPLLNGSTYDVTILSQPLGLTCSLSNNSGTINNANVTNVSITCSVNTYSVGGQSHGLTSGTLVLQNNGGDNISLTNDAPFTFPTPLPNGSNYNVTILSQPAGLTCSLSNNSGTINNANVTNVSIICSPITYSVGGTLVGYASADPVLLQNNNGDTLSLNSNGPFTFSTRIAQSSSYNVTVFTQPTGQSCTVENGSGTNVMADVTNIVVRCANQSYLISGTVTGLVSPAQLPLQTNGVNTTVIGTSSGNALFTFPAVFANGTVYNVVVTTQPNNLNCTVTNGSGTISGSNVTNVAVNCVATVNPTTLNISPANLALSVTGRTEYGVGSPPPTASGVPRVLTITNTGAFTANNLVIEVVGLPITTTTPSTCGASLAAGASCTITVTPGIDASTTDGTNSCNRGAAPTPGTIFFSADNASAVSSSITVLDYGCIYASGYVYALDDSNAAGSVKGKVATTMDQSTPKIWSSDSAGNYSGSEIYGTSEISTTVSPHPNNPPVLLACNGSTDGACDTANIFAYYQVYAIDSPINLSFYAAGLCKQTISGFSNWYLPAICEMGYGTFLALSCGTQATPTLQNMQSNLVEFNSLALLTGQYWSSTTYAGATINQAWRRNFGVGGASFAFKGDPQAVRCSRVF